MTSEQELKKLGVFNEEFPDYVEELTKSIPNINVPYKMKVALTITEIIRFVSQFKKNILLSNDSLIPINSLTFCLAKSGIGKDSSIRAVSKCFEDSYKFIEELRKTRATNNAIEKANEEGLTNPESWSVYKDFYMPPCALSVGISTPEGLIQYLDDISKDILGSGYVYSGEFATELLSNPNILENIKILSEVYDEGLKVIKVLKDRAKQTNITNVVASGLFMSSPDLIIYSDPVKNRFKSEFNTKLARRSFFIFVDKPSNVREEEDIYASIQLDKIREEEAKEVRNVFNAELLSLTKDLVDSIGEPITIHSDTEMLFYLYKRYNEDEGNKISDIQHPISKLNREHMQWKALKLAGAFALMDNSTEILQEHYINAIRFVEFIANDIALFENELMKEPYESFCSYMKENTVDGKSSIKLHSLKKLGYITAKTSPLLKMKELVQLANSYDTTGDYTINEDCIHYTELIQTDDINITYLAVEGTKEERAKKCSMGYVSETCVFEDLVNMLEGDFAYSPFKFANGRRGNDYIEGGCKWIVLDVDKSQITDEEAHLLLSDIKHIIVRTSDKDNAFKFRILIELDAEIDIPSNAWKLFLKVVAEDLGLIVDYLSKSHILFSYSDSFETIKTNFEAEPLVVKPYLVRVQRHIDEGPTPVTKISASRKKELLDNPMDTFAYAYMSKSGEGSRNLIRAARHAKDLGASREEVLNLLIEINNYWEYGLSDERFDMTIRSQILRWEF